MCLVKFIIIAEHSWVLLRFAEYCWGLLSTADQKALSCDNRMIFYKFFVWISKQNQAHRVMISQCAIKLFSLWHNILNITVVSRRRRGEEDLVSIPWRCRHKIRVICHSPYPANKLSQQCSQSPGAVSNTILLLLHTGSHRDRTFAALDAVMKKFWLHTACLFLKKGNMTQLQHEENKTLL